MVFLMNLIVSKLLNVALKALFIVVILIGFPPLINAGRTSTNQRENANVGMENSQQVINSLKAKRDNSMAYFPNLMPPTGYTEYRNESNESAELRTFRNRNGKLISLSKRDNDNYIWALPKYEIDKYTGDTIIKDPSYAPLALKMVMGRDTLAINAMKRDTNGDVMVGNEMRGWFLSPDKLNIFSVSSIFGSWGEIIERTKDFWNGRKNVNQFCYSIIPAGDFPIEQGSKSRDSNMAIFWDQNNKILEPVKVQGTEYHLKPNDNGCYLYFIAFKYGSDDYEPITKYVQFTNTLGETRYVQFLGSDKIEKVEDTDRYLQLSVNGIDQLRILKLDGEIFAGNLSRPTFKAMFFKEGMATITFLRDTVVTVADFGEIEIPEGSIYQGKVDNRILCCPDLLSYLYLPSSDLKPDGNIYNWMGKAILTVNSDEYPRIDVYDRRNLLAERQARKSAEEASIKDSIYKAYCSKYGKAMIDEILKGKLPIGTPETLLKEVYDCELRTDSRIYRQYHVILESPTYDLKNRTISSRGGNHFVWGSINVIAGVKNGKVVSVTKLK